MFDQDDKAYLSSRRCHFPLFLHPERVCYRNLPEDWSHEVNGRRWRKQLWSNIIICLYWDKAVKYFDSRMKTNPIHVLLMWDTAHLIWSQVWNTKLTYNVHDNLAMKCTLRQSDEPVIRSARECNHRAFRSIEEKMKRTKQTQQAQQTKVIGRSKQVI